MTLVAEFPTSETSAGEVPTDAVIVEDEAEGRLTQEGWFVAGFFAGVATACLFGGC